jgi:hypothetical protein
MGIGMRDGNCVIWNGCSLKNLKEKQNLGRERYVNIITN